MYLATAGLLLPTSIIGSLPRPGWYTQNLGARDFRDAMVDRGYREQYLDALAVYLRGPDDRYHAYGISALSLIGGQIARIVVFADAGLVARFGLPEVAAGSPAQSPGPRT